MRTNTRFIARTILTSLIVLSSSNTSPAASDAAESIDGVYRFNSDQLPTPFDATGTYHVTDAGIRPDEQCIVMTREKDFLSRDFLLEVSVDGYGSIVGLGDGTDQGSIRLSDGKLALGNHWGKPIGNVHVGAAYVVQLRHHGAAITATMGVYNNGAFEADVSQTIADAKAAVPALSAHEAHLFLAGKCTFSQVSILTGASANTPASTPSATTAASPATVAPAPAGAATPTAPTPPSSIDGVYKLNSDQLPAPFEATGTFNVNTEGLSPGNNCTLITHARKLLFGDFLFEASVDVRKDQQAIIGLGDGTQDGSLRLINNSLALGDQWGKAIGKMHLGPARVMQILRHGKAITVKVGTYNNGRFETDISRTLADVKSAMPRLNEHEAHLFLTGDARFSQVTILTGEAAGPAPSIPRVVVVPTGNAPSPDAPPSVVIVPPKPAAVPTTPGTPAPAPGARVDLLAAIDPARDAISGRWTKVRDALVLLGVNDRSNQMIALPVEFPDEYDISLTLNCTRAPFGEYSFVLQVPVDGAIRQFGMLMGTEGGRIGFWNKGKTLANSRSEKIVAIKLNEPHHLVLKVRAASAEAFLEDLSVYKRFHFSGLKTEDKKAIVVNRAEFDVRDMILSAPIQDGK